jgi:hypothetical protein
MIVINTAVKVIITITTTITNRKEETNLGTATDTVINIVIVDVVILAKVAAVTRRQKGKMRRVTVMKRRATVTVLTRRTTVVTRKQKAMIKRVTVTTEGATVVNRIAKVPVEVLIVAAVVVVTGTSVVTATANGVIERKTCDTVKTNTSAAK